MDLRLFKFLTEKCEFGDDFRVSSADLYASYRAWSGKFPTLRPKAFTRRVRAVLRGGGAANGYPFGWVIYGSHRYPNGTRLNGFSGMRLKP